MSFSPNSTPSVGRAEKAFREAFERLKSGKPERMAKSSTISQNNIAKEAGCDPSALRKTRFPSLIAEIQRWINENPTTKPTSPRQTILAQRHQNRSMKDKIEAMKAQRDHALSLLIEADAKIIELALENMDLRAKLPSPQVTHLRKQK